MKCCLCYYRATLNEKLNDNEVLGGFGERFSWIENVFWGGSCWSLCALVERRESPGFLCASSAEGRGCFVCGGWRGCSPPLLLSSLCCSPPLSLSQTIVVVTAIRGAAERLCRVWCAEDGSLLSAQLKRNGLRRSSFSPQNPVERSTIKITSLQWEAVKSLRKDARKDASKNGALCRLTGSFLTWDADFCHLLCSVGYCNPWN